MSSICKSSTLSSTISNFTSDSSPAGDSFTASSSVFSSRCKSFISPSSISSGAEASTLSSSTSATPSSISPPSCASSFPFFSSSLLTSSSLRLPSTAALRAGCASSAAGGGEDPFTLANSSLSPSEPVDCGYEAFLGGVSAKAGVGEAACSDEREGAFCDDDSLPLGDGVRVISWCEPSLPNTCRRTPSKDGTESTTTQNVRVQQRARQSARTHCTDHSIIAAIPTFTGVGDLEAEVVDFLSTATPENLL